MTSGVVCLGLINHRFGESTKSNGNDYVSFKRDVRYCLDTRHFLGKGKRKMITKEFTESRDEMEKILSEESLGYLGLSIDDSPYVVPMNYAYINGKILFHCALKGKKLDYMKRNKFVCFTVARQSGAIEQHEGKKPCHTNSDSVMCFGNARIIEEITERHNALNAFTKCFRPDSEEITVKRTKRCYVVEIKINEMTGRQETNQEGKKRTYTYWQYKFDN